MLKSFRFQAFMLLAGGALLGYAAANVNFTDLVRAKTAEPKSPTGKLDACESAPEPSGSCCSTASRSQFVAKLDTRSDKTRAKRKRDGVGDLVNTTPSRAALISKLIAVPTMSVGANLPATQIAGIASLMIQRNEAQRVALMSQRNYRNSMIGWLVQQIYARQQGSVSGGKQKRPNILVIFGDDIGYWNLSYNNRGMMGYMTPNIDRIAREGMMFTDYYGQQSCTAGRAAFITGQIPVRTGLTKVGMPAARVGLQPEDPTLATLLQLLGYVSGQFGKNHLGDRNEFLPTVHGFDEFYGNLYHLNAEEEPENIDYPGKLKLPNGKTFRQQFGPRGVLKSKATKKDDKTVDPRFGKVGKQTIEDTGPLTKKRMETVDDEFMKAAKDFIRKAHKEGKPFFTWFNSTRMHFYTHIRKANQTKRGFYADGMVEHDRQVGQLLALLDELEIADNTIVIYTTDNGPHYNEWPDGGITIFRGEKNTNWEGAFRVPCVIRWPGHVPANSVSNGIVSHEDWIPTLVAAAGDSKIKAKLLKGVKIGDRTYKVHLDGYNLLPHITGKTKESPRRAFYYFSDDGDMMAIRFGDWQVVYMEQRAHRFDVWRDPFIRLRTPKIFNLRRDPFQRADTDSNNYNHWWAKHAYMVAPATAVAMNYMNTFKDFPPRQRPESWNLDEVMEKLKNSQQVGGR